MYKLTALIIALILSYSSSIFSVTITRTPKANADTNSIIISNVADNTVSGNVLDNDFADDATIQISNRRG